MTRVFVRHRSLRGLLIAGLIGVIAGLPFLCIASNTQPVVLSETEDSSDGKTGSMKSDDSDVVGFCRVVGSVAARAFRHRVADEWAETESVLTESHLQRGPPGC